MVDDPDDVTFDPEMSINLPRPVDMKDDECVQDVNVEQEVIDIIEEDTEDTENSEIEYSSTGKNKLLTYSNSEEEDGLILVSEASLRALAKKIPITECENKSCKETVSLSSRKNASGITLNWMCPKSHNSLTWTSQPVLPNGVMVGNFKICAAIVMSGNNYSKVALMAKFMRLGFPSASMFDRIQGQYIIPEVDRYWLTIKQSTQEELRATSIVVAGDGRMDCPGHSAKYCTYTVMNQTDKKIVSMEVIDKREVQLKSGQLEVRGFRKTMDDIKDAGIEVKEIVTDAHPQISSIMRKDFPDIRHSWDMWHGAKNLGKKLHAAALEKGNSHLKPWVSGQQTISFTALKLAMVTEMFYR
ncbi:uncharacterized protein LOC128550965 [Mercenaria mercenaria]|uniref:uncharacterized protein LOC128550965 n=1 Tax=Mercenaria mercenaria TaxID=6596 RepID=UPI00234EB750|nr:uncharacterized protein LOC128550965 [Mercenaria mercenaria]